MYDKDAVSKVQAALEREVHLDLRSTPIDIQIKEGKVCLEGEVSHISTKKQALRTVAHLSEVVEVVDKLRVATPHHPGDGATRDAVCRWLMHDTNFQNCVIRICTKGREESLRDGERENASGNILVGVEDGVVSLSGHVISLSHKRLAGVLAWWAQGVRDVENLLHVAPPEEDNDDEIVDGLRLVLECDPYVHAEQITIESHGGTVVLEGEVSSEDERLRTETDAWCLHAVDRVTNHIRVRA
ncbi:MAG TPA: BON domain-containing protein [Rhodocyclaceae bacterium]|nr:BON domain-containing protein [Rhodocyclaceae bacterium]